MQENPKLYPNHKADVTAFVNQSIRIKIE